MKSRLLLISVLLVLSVVVAGVYNILQKSAQTENTSAVDSCAVKSNFLIDSLSAQKLGEALFVDTTVCAVEIFYTRADLDDLRSRHPDDDAFYAVADDMNYYQATARSFLEEQKIKIYYLPDSLQAININNRYWIDRKKAGYALFILYQDGKEPIITKPINIEKAALDYFGADRIVIKPYEQAVAK